METEVKIYDEKQKGLKEEPVEPGDFSSPKTRKINIILTIIIYLT